MSGIKEDCFAYSKDRNRCNALKSLYCKDGECGFYKKKGTECDSCKSSIGRIRSCDICRDI